jgi:hypothetical protein
MLLRGMLWRAHHLLMHILSGEPGRICLKEAPIPQLYLDTRQVVQARPGAVAPSIHLWSEAPRRGV